ncbi:alpha/beta hydrolase [Isoptericola sp. NEAU-Y5]|uniref:Alpha/beta hydrolase n=1 Tax=Isoptericola luteus TaxID=2879484 RepID=A0ABS7ZIS7_9MICO|nr:alpha/beta hydrolase [Isoptericola sp. NEAU-Y5]MCA5894387.1 alpha/beta hydrolase [Isoptericola sp. NEAU-Y5]
MTAMSDSSDFSSALVDGPWRHELVPANGARFHVALAGPERPTVGGRPLVLLLHGYPQFWWAWRHQVTALADAGYRVAAMDLRGVGASDKPPSGYDVPTSTRDVAGVVRSLGHDRAVVVGHGSGGTIAWSMARLQPAVTAGVAAFASPHPARLHVSGSRLLTGPARRALTFYQLPTLPERRLVDGDLVARVLAAGGGGAFPSDDAELYRTVMRIPFAAHTVMESLRWLVRSTPRPDGRRYLTAIRQPIGVPVLQVHGSADPFLRPEYAGVDGGALARDFRLETVDGAGHFLPEQAADDVSTLLLDWLPRTATDAS